MIKSSRAFESAIRRLNQGQKEAVSRLEGPVLVLAGPGTGKTDVLTLRIGTLLLETQASPYNILCLTFTEAATAAMRSRLIEYIGSEAENVFIQTFHGFCNRVIQDHKESFGPYVDLQPATELEKVEIIEHILDTVPEQSPLKRRRGDRYADRNRLLNLFNLMKQEGWTRTFLLNTIDTWIEEAKSHPDFVYKKKWRDRNAGDLRESKYKKEVKDKMHLLRSAVMAYEQYVDLMLDAGRYDFHDMLSWVDQKFDEDPDLLLDYQERFQYILVDEFQDTNGIQLSLLGKLTHYEKPNVFVVGDDDQAIFRFQGARVENITNFRAKYDLEALMLLENYRSTQQIIDASEAVIKINREIIASIKSLYSGKKIKSAGLYGTAEQNPKIRSFDYQDQEEAFLARDLIELHTSKMLQKNSVAVIYRRHKQVSNLIRVLQNYEVPFNLVRPVNILLEPVISNLLLLLEYVQAQYLEISDDDEKLFKIMHFQHFGIHPRDASKIAFECQKKEDAHGNKSTRKILRDVLSRRRGIKRLGLVDSQSLINFSEAIDQLCGQVHQHTLPGFFEEVLHQTGLLKWILNHEHRWWYLRLIKTFFDEINDFAERQQQNSLADFLIVIEKHKTHGVDIPVREIFREDHGIHLLTAHGAKGLEFDRVYILGCTKSDWEGYNPGRSGHFALPGNVVALSTNSSHEDERRLFYVAMTRARTDLSILFSLQDSQRKRLEPSRFITELVTGDPNSSITNTSVSQETVEIYYSSVLQKPMDISYIFDHDQISAFLKTYKLSATDLNKYLECPVAFYFEKILRIPSAQPEYLIFGNVVHKCFEKLFKQNWETLFLTTGRLLEIFDHVMKENQWKFTERQYLDLHNYGSDMLLAYGKHYEKSWRNPLSVQTEYRVKETTHRGVPLKGFIDKVEVFSDGVHLRDYKTGAYRYGKFKNPDQEQGESGGDSWRQMVFYKIILQEDSSQDWNVKKGIMDFVDIKRTQKSNGEPMLKEILFPEEHIQIVSDQIFNVFQKIKAHEFENGCEQPRCYWCQLVKTELSKSNNKSKNPLLPVSL